MKTIIGLRQQRRVTRERRYALVYDAVKQDKTSREQPVL